MMFGKPSQAQIYMLEDIFLHEGLKTVKTGALAVFVMSGHRSPCKHGLQIFCVWCEEELDNAPADVVYSH